MITNEKTDEIPTEVLMSFLALDTKEREIAYQFIKLLETTELDPEVVAGRLDHVVWHYADLMLSGGGNETDKMDGARLYTLAMLARLFKNNYNNQYI